MPTFAWSYPIDMLYVPESERQARVKLTSETCVIDGSSFSIRCVAEIPVHGYDTPFMWGLFVSIGEADFDTYVHGLERRSLDFSEPIPGELHSVPMVYPEIERLHCTVVVRPYGKRPLIQVEPKAHPLGSDQANGLTPSELQRIAETVLHGTKSQKQRKRWFWQR